MITMVTRPQDREEARCLAIWVIVSAKKLLTLSSQVFPAARLFPWPCSDDLQAPSPFLGRLHLTAQPHYSRIPKKGLLYKTSFLEL